jgi:hypothetical protein
MILHVPKLRHCAAKNTERQRQCEFHKMDSRASRDIRRDIANAASCRDILLERLGFRPRNLDEKLS